MYVIKICPNCGRWMEQGQYLLHGWPLAIAVLNLRVPLPETDRQTLIRERNVATVN